MPRLTASAPAKSQPKARRPAPRRPAPRRPLEAGRWLRHWRRVLPALAAVAVLGGAGWVWQQGHVGRTVDTVRAELWQLSVRAGLSVEEVLVTGRVRTRGEELLAALGIDRGAPILAFDPAAARDAIAALPWVKQVVVARRLPDTIVVSLEEREPLALWQHERQLRVIDSDGRVLSDYNYDDFADLPLVVGPDAAVHAQELLALLAAQPDVAGRVAAAIRVGERRWDLRLTNGIDVRLPEHDAAAALGHLARALADGNLFERDILLIDLRLEDRLVIRTSPLSAERRRLPEENT